jgi:hypothetical protein
MSHKKSWRPYTRIAGHVEGARAMWNQAPPVNKGRTVAQRNGLRFERKVLRGLNRMHPHFLDHLPFLYLSEGRQRAAIPDGIAISRSGDILTIVEIKHRHTDEAWQQLNLLYKPVVARAFPAYRIKLLEIVRWFEPMVLLPERPIQVLDPAAHFDNDDMEYGVHIWMGESGD